MTFGVVASDLHMFSTRSHAHEIMGALHEAMRDADVLILNGDIFDFRWSFLSTIQETVESSVGWLEELVQRYPDRQIHFILGNHDCHHEFLAAMDSLSCRTPSFSWHEVYLRMGNALFTHGDCLHKSRNAPGMSDYRKTWGQVKKRGPTQAAFYEMVDETGITHAAPRLYFWKARVAKGIVRYLNAMDPYILDGVEHIFVGHTHVPFTDFKYEGKTFHNTGSAMAKGGFNPLAFAIHAPERETACPAA